MPNLRKPVQIVVFSVVTASVLVAVAVGIPLPRSVLSLDALRLPVGTVASFSGVRLLPLQWAYAADGLVVTGKSGVVLRAASLEVPIEAVGAGATGRRYRFVILRGARTYAVAGWSGTAALVDLRGVSVSDVDGNPADVASVLSGVAPATADSLLVRDLVVDGPSVIATAGHVDGLNYAGGGFGRLIASDFAVRGRREQPGFLGAFMFGSVGVGGAPRVGVAGAWQPAWYSFENASASYGSVRLSVASSRWSVAGSTTSGVSRGDVSGAHLYSSDGVGIPKTIQLGWPDGAHFSMAVESAMAPASGQLDLRRLVVDAVSIGSLRLHADFMVPPLRADAKASSALIANAFGMRLSQAAASFTDDGFVSRLVEAVAVSEAIPPAAARARIAEAIADLVALASGSAPATDLVSRFMMPGGTLSVTMAPPSPLSLADLSGFSKNPTLELGLTVGDRPVAPSAAP